MGKEAVAGDGEIETVRAFPETHEPDEIAGVETDVTSEVGESRESSPDEKEEEREWVFLRGEVDCGDKEEEMSILPPPTTAFLFNSVERSAFKVKDCWGVEGVPASGVKVTVPTS